MIVKNVATGAIHDIPEGSRAMRRIKGDPNYKEVKPDETKKATQPEKSGI